MGLETEPEWRLIEWLRANKIFPEIRLSSANMESAENPKGRAWFYLPSGDRVRFDGANGFIWRSIGDADQYLTLESIMRLEQLLK